MKNHQITSADIKEWAKNYKGEPFDAILCDPPYELGFMGKSWDSTGIAYDKDMWADLLRILKPGGHLLAFSGSRTYHRMAVAIEDAGFEIRDMIEWVYGSGFPKSLNIGKAVDKLQRNEREVLGTREVPDITGDAYGTMNDKQNGSYKPKEIQDTKGTSEWEGYGTALKPAHEPCVLARKPIDGTVANNVLKHGTGGLNIDGSRVGFGNESDNRIGTDAKAGGGKESQFGSFSNVKDKNIQMYKADGRFPANLIHDGSDEVEAVFPQTGGGKAKEAGVGNGSSMFAGAGRTGFTIGDSGSASRFFYTAKASKSERNAGLEGLPEDIGVGNYMAEAKWINDPRHKDGGYLASPSKPQANHHPTVKPLSLTKYLATLIKPPTGGRLLVPFSGSGSEMIGALQAGWEYVEGVELTEEYIPIAEARIKYWLSQVKKEDKQSKLL